MNTTLIAIIAVLLLVIILLCVLLLKKNKKNDLEDFKKVIELSLKNTRDDITNTIGGKIVDNTTIQQNAITNLTQLNETKLENIRKSVEDRLTSIQKDNGEKLEKMRLTVDEKLQSTLEKRLSESFKIVSNNLESVQKGLGEMQSLAKGVGDLKNVFTNVKARGYWGEIQLANILEQFLTPEQYLTNVKTKAKSNDFVEFAIKLPGKNNIDTVLLPVDSKFPIEDYSRLVAAEESGDLEAIDESRKKLETQIKKCAKDINEKYLDPPYTTDFGIMFLPTESLYCEVIRNTDLCETLSQKYRVVISGPSTFVALLNSLQMGFRTLAIEKRSSEVWELLGIVKTEFTKFGDLLEKTNKKLVEISNTMSDATRKTRTIEKKLKNVEALPVSDEAAFYDILPSLGESETEEEQE
ncbi:MAG: DNA recombination protein RmuC [Clostridia bacterium]|nr:DNA recombination protein RmuC [Clostridia bacterium]